MTYWKNTAFIAVLAGIMFTTATANAGRPDFYNRAAVEHIQVQAIDAESHDAATPEFIVNAAVTSQQPQPHMIQLNFIQEKENDQVSPQSTQ